MEPAAEILCPSKKNLFTKVSFSGVTMPRRIDELAVDIEKHIKRACLLVYYLLAVDES
jgi:hypothetical protein